MTTQTLSDPSELMDLLGRTYHALREVSVQRTLEEPPPYPNRFLANTPADIAAYVRTSMLGLVQEQIRTVVFNSKHEVVHVEIVYQGTINEVHTRMAEIFRPAILRNAYAIAVVHNHPSGDPTPSFNDENCTRKLLRAAHLLDIELIDHIVVAEGPPTFVSIRERNNRLWHRDTWKDLL